MVYVALAQAVVIALLVAALVLREREHDKETQWLVKEEASERQVLLQRIQHPQREPVKPVPSPANPESERRQEMSDEARANYAAIGTVADA